jgi:hypothetical protein
MLANEHGIQTLDELHNYVYEVLCSYDNLQPGIFSMTEEVLVRGDKPCGIHFCLSGPRRVQYTAIWETDGNTILFYGSAGERFHKTQLTEAPNLAAAE